MKNIDTYLGGRPTPERSAIRFAVFGLVVLLGAGVLTARLIALQVTAGVRYPTLSGANRSVVEAIPSPRGVVYDRNGVALVTNVPMHTVKIRPADLPEDRRPAVVATLASLLKMDPTAINIAIDSNPGSRFDLVRIASDVDAATADFIAEARDDLPGVEVDVESRRDYSTGPLLAQILGYTAPINPDELPDLVDQGYLPDDLIGQTGVESTYEKELRGAYGIQTVQRDDTGRDISVLQTDRAPVAGDSLELTIDVHEQQLAQQALQWGMDTAGLHRGVIIVMNPQTGEILAMVSLPTYDDNLFARGISNTDFQALATNPDKPLTNHAIAEQYAPGSTFKLVTGSGGLADGKITASQKLQTAAFLSIGTAKYHDWNGRGFGACDLICGFSHSSDTYFYQVAAKLGIDRLAYWANQFGFGQRSGIDLPGEVPGIIPSNQWKMDHIGEPIFPGEVYLSGIGQSYDAVTPLQLLNAYCALANGGTLYKPRIVRDLIGPDGKVVQAFAPEVINKLPMDSSVLQTMRKAARTVVTSRHTYNLADLPIVVSGKTGTAEFGTKKANGDFPTHSWFVGFVPKEPYVQANDPGGFKAAQGSDSELAVIVLAFDAATKGNAATEMVKYFLQLHYGIEKDYRRLDLLNRVIN
jgi:penicillin-binding protein 2